MKKTTLSILLLSLASNLTLTGCFPVIAAGAATTAAVAHDRRTTGTVLDDKTLEMRALAKINARLGDDDTNRIVAIAYNNNILLVGQTNDATLKQDVESEIRDLPKVKRIYNEIQSGEAISASVRANDAWITTKVKSNMLLEKQFDSTRIKVVTEDGVVYLMGLVTKDEEETAISLARHVTGVQKVITLFEYTGHVDSQ